MRNSIYCNRFYLDDTHIEDTQTGIRYTNKSDFIAETNCFRVCDQTKRIVCDVLNHFQNLRIPNRNFFEKDEFGDPKENHNRKLK